MLLEIKVKCSRYKPGCGEEWVEVKLYSSMTTALEGMSGQQYAPTVLNPWERPGTHCTGGWVGPRAGLDGRKISPHRDSIPGPSSPM